MPTWSLIERRQRRPDRVPTAAVQRRATDGRPLRTVRSGPDPRAPPRRQLRGPAGADRGAGHRRDAGRADRRRAPDRQPFTDINDVVRRTGLTVPQTEALATAGAFDCFGLSRRQALWNAGYADNDQTLPGSAIDASAARRCRG